MSLERLQKAMAAAGVASRRQCETLIAEGRVQVNGRVVTQAGTQIDPAVDDVKVDGQRLRRPALVHLLLHKPRGAVCSQVSLPGLPRAIDYVPAALQSLRLFTIGRLDVDSEGAILLTNDGELTHLVTHPRFEVEKTYRVEVEGAPDDATLAKVKKGVWLAEGRTGSVRLELVRRHPKGSILIVKLKEGRKREVRRLFARFGHEVRRLLRVAIGPVKLGRLPAGGTRPLSPHEVQALRQSARAVIRLGAPSQARGIAAVRRGHRAAFGARQRRREQP